MLRLELVRALTVVELRTARHGHRSRSIPDVETPVGAARRQERMEEGGREGGRRMHLLLPRPLPLPRALWWRRAAASQSALAPNGGRHAKADGIDTFCNSK